MQQTSAKRVYDQTRLGGQRDLQGIVMGNGNLTIRTNAFRKKPQSLLKTDIILWDFEIQTDHLNSS